MKPLISIIIPTYNGESHIVDTLSSLTTQTYSSFEVVVIVDGSQDNTAQAIGNAKLRLSLEVHEQTNKGRAGARNAGLAFARGEYIVFLDDDVLVPQSLIETYVRKIEEGHIVVAGTFYPVYKYRNEFSRYASYLNERWNSDLLTIVDNVSKPYLSAGNMLIKKSVFLSIQGFDGTLRDAEDADLAVRLTRAGIAIYFDPDLKVGHTIHDNFWQHVQRQQHYKEANNILAERNSTGESANEDYKIMGFAKRLAYRMLSGRGFLRLIDIGAFRILPSALRFRIYDILVTAYVMQNTRSKSSDAKGT